MAGLIRIILRERLRPALEPINHGSSRFGTTNHFARLGIAPKRLGAGTILRAVTWPKGAYEPLQLVTVPILSAISTGGYTEAFAEFYRSRWSNRQYGFAGLHLRS
jgi:hypothetical protein